MNSTIVYLWEKEHLCTIFLYFLLIFSSWLLQTCLLPRKKYVLFWMLTSELMYSDDSWLNIHCYFTDNNSQSHFALAKHLGPEGKIKSWSWQVFFQIWFILYSKNSKNDPECAVILLALSCKLGIFDIRQKRQSYEKNLSQKGWLQFLPILKKIRKKFLLKADDDPDSTDYVV